jgi:two-component system, OmpR family, phosphate regulon sensor histidine kinase PhoR
MLSSFIKKLRENVPTAILTAAVLGALLLQLNLLSGQLELQRQQFEAQIGTTSSRLSERVRLFVRRKSMGSLTNSVNVDSVFTINTPMGQTTVRWSNAQIQNPYGIGTSDTAMLGGLLDDFQSSLPWSTQLDMTELDSIIVNELKQNGVRTEPVWALIENGYLSTLTSEGFDPQKVTFNYVLSESFFGPTRQLLLYFPSEKFYLAKRVYLSLMASLLFSTVILTAFFGVQRHGRRQKRLADVKSDFINNMSHEFKTPLATINLAVDAIIKNGDKMDADQIRNYLAVIKTENKRMNAQMESVLQMSMMDKEELTLQRAQMSIENVVQEAVEHFKLSVAQRNGWIDLVVSPGSYTYFGDPTQFKSALTNLIDNGIKYSVDVPRISVKLSEEDYDFVIIVKDRGIGMNEETTSQVFDRFFRATKGNIHDVKGHGLGLSFVQEIVDKHGGVIDVQSKIGVGSTFIIKIVKNQ